MQSGMFKKSGGGLNEAIKQLQLLAQVEALVGFPADTANRDDGSINNATLAYIHDNGAPEANIPQRAFMLPGIQSANTAITNALQRGVKSALAGDSNAAQAAMHKAGLAAKVSIQLAINEGIPPPLAESTLRARARRGRKGAKVELQSRAEGTAPGVANAKPLVDTGQLRNAVNYAIRARAR